MRVVSYFDLIDLTTDEELVPITFAIPSFSIGRDVHARSTADGEPVEEISAGCVATMPLWAASTLRQEGYVSVGLPTHTFSLAAFREFKTDPLAPSLALRSPVFAEAGLRLCGLLGNPTPNGHVSPEGNRLAAQVIRLFQLRCIKIIYAAAKQGFDLSEVREKLTESERYLLDASLRWMTEEQRWIEKPI